MLALISKGGDSWHSVVIHGVLNIYADAGGLTMQRHSYHMVKGPAVHLIITFLSLPAVKNADTDL